MKRHPLKKRILYGNANYKEIIQKNGYFIDKTPYIEALILYSDRRILVKIQRQ